MRELSPKVSQSRRRSARRSPRQEKNYVNRNFPGGKRAAAKRADDERSKMKLRWYKYESRIVGRYAYREMDAKGLLLLIVIYCCWKSALSSTKAELYSIKARRLVTAVDGEVRTVPVHVRVAVDPRLVVSKVDGKRDSIRFSAQVRRVNATSKSEMETRYLGLTTGNGSRVRLGFVREDDNDTTTVWSIERGQRKKRQYWQYCGDDDYLFGLNPDIHTKGIGATVLYAKRNETRYYLRANSRGRVDVFLPIGNNVTVSQGLLFNLAEVMYAPVPEPESQCYLYEKTD